MGFLDRFRRNKGAEKKQTTAEILEPILESDIDTIINKLPDIDVPISISRDGTAWAEVRYDTNGAAIARDGSRIEKIIWDQDITARGDPQPMSTRYFTALASDLKEAMIAVAPLSGKDNILNNASKLLRERSRVRLIDVSGDTLSEIHDSKANNSQS